jgi:hypothetical protein
MSNQENLQSTNICDSQLKRIMQSKPNMPKSTKRHSFNLSINGEVDYLRACLVFGHSAPCRNFGGITHFGCRLVDVRGDIKRNCNTGFRWVGPLGTVGEWGCGGRDGLEVVLDSVAEDEHVGARAFPECTPPPPTEKLGDEKPYPRELPSSRMWQREGLTWGGMGLGSSFSLPEAFDPNFLASALLVPGSLGVTLFFFAFWWRWWWAHRSLMNCWVGWRWVVGWCWGRPQWRQPWSAVAWWQTIC